MTDRGCSGCAVSGRLRRILQLVLDGDGEKALEARITATSRKPLGINAGVHRDTSQAVLLDHGLGESDEGGELGLGR